MTIDSHTHYSHFRFNDRFRYLSRENGSYCVKEGSREDVLAELKACGIVEAIEPAIDLASNRKVLDLCASHPGFLFPAVGVHPTRVAQLKREDRQTLREYASDKNVVAVGETGLDYHYERKEQHRLRQLYWFQYQIDLAARCGLPLVLHIRLAYKDAIRVLRLNHRKLRGGVAHCFCGTKEEALQLVGLGFRIGIGGALLQENEKARELQEAVRRIPLESILAETDAPYVLPDVSDLPLSSKVKRKIRNTSLILPEVIGKIAELKGVDRTVVEKAICRNTAETFGLPLP